METTEEKEGAKVKELFLDTKGSCFLCLKETEISNGYTGTTTMKEICVRNICKYLHISPSLVLLQSLKDSRELTKEEVKEASAQRNQCDFSVPMCINCSVLATQLTKLIGELEMIEMNMNLRLQQFHKRLTTSEQEIDSQYEPRWEKFQEKMKTSENPVEARLVETLRNQTKTKCFTRLKQLLAASNPRVTLKRLQTNPKTAEPQLLPLPPPPPVDTVSSKNGSLETPSTATLNATETDAINKQMIMEICTTQFQPVEPGGNRYEPPKAFKDPYLFVCDVANGGSGCGKRFKKKVSLIQHKRICKLHICNVGYGGCGEKFTNLFALRLHDCPRGPPESPTPMLIDTVYSLKDSPETPSTLSPNATTTDIDAANKKRILKICNSYYESVPPGNGYKCTICNNTYSSQHYRFHVHVIICHPEKIFLHPSLLNLGREKLRELKRSVLDAETENPSIKCAVCNGRYGTRLYLKRHLVFNHFSYVEERMLNAVNLNRQNKTQSLITLGASPTTNTKQMIMNLCTTQFQPVASDASRYECKICKGSTTYSPEKRNFSEHVIRLHPEKVFLHQTLQDLGKEKLLELVRRVVKAETESSAGNQCVVCRYRFTRTYNLKCHLVLAHFSYVEKKLLDAVSLGQNRTLSASSSGTPNTHISKPKPCQNLSTEDNSQISHVFARRLPDCTGGRRFKKRPPRKSFAFKQPRRYTTHADSFTILMSEIFAQHAVPAAGRLVAGKSSRRGYHCGICRPSGKAYVKRELCKHFVDSHLDLFFTHKKRDTMSAEKFGMHCKNVLRDTSCYTPVRSVRTKKIEYLCSFCRLRHRATYELRHHLMAHHHDILERMVGQALEGHLGASTEHNLGNDSQAAFEGEPSGQHEVEMEEENEEKPVIGEEVFFEIDMNSYPTTTNENVRGEFNATTMTGLNVNGEKKEMQLNEINCWQDECRNETILPDL